MIVYCLIYTAGYADPLQSLSDTIAHLDALVRYEKLAVINSIVLVLVHKAYKKEIAIPIPEYIKIQERSTRHSSCSIVGEALNYIQPYAKRDFYKFSFLPRTIMEWNSLPPDVKGHQQIDSFRQAVRQYIE